MRRSSTSVVAPSVTENRRNIVMMPGRSRDSGSAWPPMVRLLTVIVGFSRASSSSDATVWSIL